MKIRARHILAATFALLAAHAAAQPASISYHLVKSIPLGAPDHWDYVVFDAGSHRVFVAHGDRVSVVDATSGQVVGEIAGVPGGTHGTSVSTATGQGFTDDGKAGVAVAFDLATLKVLKRIPAQPDADGVVTDPATGHVFVIDGDSARVTVIDPKADAPIADIALGGKLEAAVAGRDGRVYVDGAEKGEVVVIDSRANAVTARWRMPACLKPKGIAVDDTARRVFVSCANSLMTVLDARTGRVVAALPIGRGTDAAAWDPRRKLAFSSNGEDGTISVIRQLAPDRYVTLPPIRTVRSARTMALDPSTGRLFVAAVELEPSGVGIRLRTKPGTLRLMFYDPDR